MGFPLDRVRILELGQIIAGTYGGQILSDLGAEVIKVETPEGDLGRIPSVAPLNGESALFLTLNRNKQSIVINLKTDEGREVFYGLVRKSDVVVDNFRPGVLERLKIDYQTLKALKPDIIQCSITGYGESGEYKDYPALDIIIQAMAGYLAITGEPGRPPVRTGIPIADLCGGIFSSKAILAALFDRERSGEGRRIELSMFDGMLSLLIYIATMWLSKGELAEPTGSGHMYSVPWQAFECADGYVVVATRQEVFWSRFCQAIEAPELAEDPRFATNPDRVANRDALVPILEDMLARRTVGDWMERFRRFDIPAAPVNNLDGAFAAPPVAERDMIVEYTHAVAGKVRLPGNPIKMSGMEGTISKPAPLLGEHTDRVLGELLGLSRAEIARLRAAGVVK
jgi:crotonobetainyl-CoA:carnitine CoA-transferase CaiB-like acyl-CoA transferase